MAGTTLDSLEDLPAEANGEGAEVPSGDGDGIDTPFTGLGYDVPATTEPASMVGLAYDISLVTMRRGPRASRVGCPI